MKSAAYRLGEYEIIEHEHGDLWWETHIGLGSMKSGKCFINGDILFIKPSAVTEPGFLKGEFIDHINKPPKWKKTKYFCKSYKIYHCRSDCIKLLSEALDSRLQKETIVQKIGSTQKQDDKIKRKPAETAMAECISYKLCRYKFIVKSNGQLFWQSHTGLTGLKNGRCHIKGNILFLEPGKPERSGSIKRKFMQHLARLPDWEKTQYFCPSYTIYYSKTSTICRHFGEDKDSKKGDAEDFVAESKNFSAGIKIDPIVSDKVIAKIKSKIFFNFLRIFMMLILRLLLGCIQIIYLINRSFIGRWTGLRSWLFNCLTGRKRVR